MLNIESTNFATVREVNSIFGKYSITPENSVTIVNGMIGFPNISQFAMVMCPHQSLANFVILHSLDDDSLRFLTMPLPNPRLVYREEDYAQILADMQSEEGDLQFFLIVTLHHEKDFVRLTANSQAPIVLSSSTRRGRQYPLSSGNYELQMKI